MKHSIGKRGCVAITLAMFTFVAIADEPAAVPPSHAPKPVPPENSTEERIRLSFKDARWGEVLDKFAEMTGLTLLMDAPPPGRFTYDDPREYTVEEALDVVHSVLLDRGITLIRKGGMLMTAHLGDDMPWELLSFVPAEHIDRVAPHEMIVTALPLHSVPGWKLAMELEPALSPRGKIVGNKVSRRLIVYDRAGICAQIQEMLSIIDPPLDSNAVRMRIYQLTHATVREVAPIVKELIGPVEEGPIKEKGKKGGEDMMDVDAMSGMFFSKSFLSSFTPGFSLDGVAQDTPRDKLKTRMSIEPTTNAMIILAEASILGKVDDLVDALDRPSRGDAVAPILIKSYPTSTSNAADLAKRMQAILGAKSDCTVSGVDRLIVVRGTADQHAQVRLLLDSLNVQDETLAGFPLSRRRAEDLVAQFERIFALDGKAAPRLVADTGRNTLLVRGTEAQVNQVRRMLTELEELEPTSQAAPRLKVRTGGGSRNNPRPD